MPADSAYGFSIIGPDPKNSSDENYADSPGSDVIQRVCNGTVNPVTQSTGVCETQGSLFNHGTSGILHFSSDSSAEATASSKLNRSALGVERLSAYRFLDEEVLSFEDGGALLWRNSDNNPKCHALWTNPRGASHRSMVRSYTWVYQWPAMKTDERVQPRNVTMRLGRPSKIDANRASLTVPQQPGKSCVEADGSAKASCFGFNATDSTAILQTAFASGASLLSIDSIGLEMLSWVVTPLFLSNITDMVIRIEPGVTIQAKSGAFHQGGDCLLLLRNCRNVTLTGGVSVDGTTKKRGTLRMRRSDYADPAKYRKAEWRMAVRLDETNVDINILNLHITESGGDVKRPANTLHHTENICLSF